MPNHFLDVVNHFSLPLLHLNMHRWTRSSSRKKSQVSTPGGCHHNRTDELRFVFLSWKPSSSSEKNTLTLGNRALRVGGLGSSFNFCWEINWAFRWAEWPWIRKDEKRKSKRRLEMFWSARMWWSSGREEEWLFLGLAHFLSWNLLLQNTSWVPVMLLKVSNGALLKMIIMKSWCNYSKQMKAWWKLDGSCFLKEIQI